MRIEELIDLYGDGVLRLCLLYLGDRQLAEDAFQETFIKAWKRMPSFRGESSVKTWLSRIAVNTCKSMLRSPWLRLMRRSSSVDALADFPEPQADNPPDVARAVCALPDKYREVVVLYYYEDMKIREIAQALGLAQNSVSTRLRRARALLGDALKEEVDA